MPKRPNGEQGTSLPRPRTELVFRGFPEFRSNVLYTPKQFFTVVIPHSSVNCIRLVAHMLRKTLGWVDENGDPLQERHEFSYREFEEQAGIVHSGLQKAVDEAVKAGFVRTTQRARIQRLGIQSKSAAYELVWNSDQYTDDPNEFHGFYLQPGYVDVSGQNRIGRKNIPNVFFDYLIRRENRAVIRVVGTLLWYSIDWGKGGERRTTIKKSLRDLVELTQLAKGSVVRALDEAIEKGYIERVEPGVFDLAGNQHGSVTVYGIKWTKDYVYSPEGFVPVALPNTERSKNETRPPGGNAPKMRHAPPAGTLQKRDTGDAPERSKNETRNAPKTRHAERSKNETIRISKTDISNTLINSSSKGTVPTSVAAAEEALRSVGFDDRACSELAGRYSAEIIFRQIASLPHRRATKNPLGLLRQAIVDDWAEPILLAATDVGSSLGGQFAASFYAGYHGNTDAPVAEPSAADTEVAERFVHRLMGVAPDHLDMSACGHQFGRLVANEHGQKRQRIPALRLAIQRYGDDFYSRVKESFAAEAKRAIDKAHRDHYEQFRSAYEVYLVDQLAHHEQANSPLFQMLMADENEKLRSLRASRSQTSVEQLCAQYLSGRLERFSQLIVLEEGHGVLDFWAWDQAKNKERFTGATNR